MTRESKPKQPRSLLEKIAQDAQRLRLRPPSGRKPYAVIVEASDERAGVEWCDDRRSARRYAQRVLDEHDGETGSAVHVSVVRLVLVGDGDA